MSFFTVAVLGTFFALFYAMAIFTEARAYAPVRLDDVNPAIREASWSGLRPGGTFRPDDSRTATPVRRLVFQYRSPGSAVVEKLRRAAVEGDAQAQFNLGLCYESGREVAKDLVEAVKWFRAAADQGYDEAQYTLGCCYNGDEGFPRNVAEAIKWWTKAAEQGYADAQYCLGLSYYMGQGVARNPIQATKWWGEAAEQDHANAQYFLGLCYFTGLGVPKQENLAQYWLRKAAVHGNENARIALKKMGDSSDLSQRK